MASTPGAGNNALAGGQSNMTHVRTATSAALHVVVALVLVCAAAATTGVSAFVAPTSHVVSPNQKQPRTGASRPAVSGTRLQLSTFGSGNNNNGGEGYSTSNVNDAYVRSTQSSTYRPLFDGGTNSVELPTSGIGNGRNNGNGRGLGRNGSNRGNSFNSNSFGNTYNANGRTQQRKQNNSRNAGGGLANLFNFGNQGNKNNFNTNRNQQQRYSQPAASYRNTNSNGLGGFGGAGNRRTSNISNRISDGGRGYTSSGTTGSPSLSVGRLFRQQQKQQRQQLQRTGRYTYNNANSNQQFRNLNNNMRGGTSTGRLSDLGKSQANRQLIARNRAAEQAAQRRLRQAQGGNNGFNTRFQSNALGNSFQGVGLGGSSARRAGVRLSDVGKANADREQQRRQREAERRQRAERQRLEKQKRDQRLKEERERKRRRSEQQRREREQNRFTRQQKLEQQRRERQNRSLATYGSGGNNRGTGTGGSSSKLFDYDQYGRKRYSGWTAPLSIEGIFGGRNSIGSGVLNNSYKANLNARNGYGDGNRNYYKYSTATSPSSTNAPNINTAAASLVNSAAFSAGRNSGGFNAQGSSSANNNRVRLSDIGKYDDSNRRGVGRSVRLGKAPSYNAFDRFSNDNRALSWQDRMDRTLYRGDGISRRSSTSGRYYDSNEYGNEYGFRNKNVWGGRWRGPLGDFDRRDGVIDVDYTTSEMGSAYERGNSRSGRRRRRGPNILQKISKSVVDSGAKMRIMNEIKKLETTVENRKSRFNAEVYDIMAEIDNEYSRYGRGALDNREMEMMDREKDSRTRRAYDKARRDIDIIQDRIDRLREELFDLEDAMSETWGRRDDDYSFRRSLPPARREDYYDRQRRRSSDRFSLPPSDGSRSRLSGIGRDDRSSRMPVGRSRYEDYESRDPARSRLDDGGMGENIMQREELDRQRRVQDEIFRRQDEMQMMEDERRRRQQEEEENFRFQQQQRQQEEEEMYRMQQARQEQEEREMMMYNNGDGYRRDEYDRMAGQQQQQQQQQPPRPQDEATWTRDDEVRAVNDPYRRVDPSGRPSESGRGGVQGQTSTTRRVDDRYGNSVGQW